jgi:hypothetical protein
VPCRVDRHRAILDAEHGPHVCKKHGKATPSCRVVPGFDTQRRRWGTFP